MTLRWRGSVYRSIAARGRASGTDVREEPRRGFLLWRLPIFASPPKSTARPASLLGRGALATVVMVACAGTTLALGASLLEQQPGVPSARPVDPPKEKKPTPTPPQVRPPANPPRTTPGAPTPVAPPNQPRPAAPTTQPNAQPATQPATQPPQPGTGSRGVPIAIPGAPEPASGTTAVQQPVTPPPATAPLPTIVEIGDAYRFGPFPEPIELGGLIQLMIEEGKLEVVTLDGALPILKKKVEFQSPLTIPRDKLLSFLATLLQSQGASFYRDDIGYYIIGSASETPGNLGTDRFSTTRIIPTKGLRPSSLGQAIGVGIGGGGGGAALCGWRAGHAGGRAGGGLDLLP